MYSLHVLHHDNGVVHHHADGKHDAEQRQQVDGKTEREHAGEGADQRNEDSDNTDDRGTETLQEEVDDQYHQEYRLKQGVDHLVDGEAHEIGGVKGYDVLDAVGHRRFHVLHHLAHLLGNIEPVRARLLVDDDWGCRRPVQPVVVDVLPATDFCPGDILDANDGAAVRVRAENDVLVLRRLHERCLRHNREGQLHVLGTRLLTHLACSEQGILFGYGILYICRGDRHGRPSGPGSTRRASPGQACRRFGPGPRRSPV